MKKEWPEQVQKKLKQLPASPGCYIYRDAGGDVLYVGKAINLRNRVRSYFQASTNHQIRIARMVSKICEIEWIVVDSEIEALILECNLIKKYRPPYNVLLRDDKSYPYITITNEKFPRLMFTRRVKKDGSKYFGPYISAYSVRETLQLLHKTFPLIPCGKSWSGRAEQRPCLYFHLGQCLAPCAGLANNDEYKEVIQEVQRFLSGKGDDLVGEFEKQMQQAADDLDFEKAAKIRDKIQALESVLQRQKVLTADPVDQDVIAVVKDERGAAIQMLYIRSGKLIGQRQFMLDGSSDSAPGEAVQEFVKQYYSDAPEVPREILLPVEIAEKQIVQQWLKSRRGSAVTLDVPQRGEKRKLVEMAATNAEQALHALSKELAEQEEWAEEAMSQLQEAVENPTPPMRIEGYDISNISGTAPVGSMVVFENGRAAKSEYRRFRIRFHPESPNDFAMMHEVITRRLRAYVDGDPKFAKLPDLIMIDGGKGQLSAALKARDDVGLSVPMVGLAKKMELIYKPIEGSAAHPESLPRSGDREEQEAREWVYHYEKGSKHAYAYQEIELPLQSHGLTLLRRLRDEAHRFALSFHRKIRDKRMQGSAIEEIPGIGPRRKRLLLRTFGSLEGIRKAKTEEIAAVPTMTQRLAEQVKEYLTDV
ncbi:MAG: excinuclease ABC subunit UvrC [Fimbriimonadaceae bacterium]|nr:excinuclease ABC subunit UvrC [Fimbriimonadaceae bacterium]